ncbi:DapH/DapD/GlmU-related protein [Pedobacter arcticus]|uniref:DapH/DapD/GlmU-related protein n=1 Tax=Pedobacter arcticus TaxID=752140 RepID=UPI0002D91C21|nr:DapH/DapD/GlmU-related protein [Pedobacter arcticus]
MLRRYGVFGCFKLILSLIFTKLFYTNARLIRLPFDIRNKRYIKIKKGFTTGFGCRLEAVEIAGQNPPSIILGENIQINDYVHIASGELVSIGNNVLIASKVFITDINHGEYSNKFSDSPLSIPNNRKLSTRPVIIEDNVWLGENVCILPGVFIGAGSIIGAASVVTKDIPSYSIAVGNPAKVVKFFDFAENSWKKVNT